MPDKQPNQRSLFEDSVPQMPEGYYASDPNPNLRAFVEEHRATYDPATDTYNVTAFNEEVPKWPATALYNMHTYWSKKPHGPIRQYIRHYTRPGDLVFDPFAGSGGTAYAALVEGRKAIAIDRSPAATFITKHYCTPLDIISLQADFEALLSRVREEINFLYETRCDRCDGRATTVYMVYSAVYECPRCLSRVPLYDTVEAHTQTTAGRQKTIRACPSCFERGQVEEISTHRLERHAAIPVEVRYECMEGCSPARDTRHHQDRNLKKRDYFRKYDLEKLDQIEQKSIPHWYPDIEFPRDFDRWNRDLRLLGINHIADLYTKRNLWALAAFFEAANSAGLDSIRFVLSSLLLKASLMMGHNSDGVGRIKKGTYYVPPVGHDIHVGAFVEDTFADLLRAAERELSGLKAPDVLISTETATRLAGIDANSIDYIFTDPPYAEKVQYGELNFVWEAWLGLDLDWRDEEIIVNDQRGVSLDDWRQMLREAMSECYRVLKPGRWISVCYHDTSEGTWQIVQDIMAEVGFISEDTDTILAIEMNRKTENQMFAEKITKRDLVINFRKPRPDEVPGELLLLGSEDKPTFREKARTILRQALEDHPGSPADRLYDTLVSRAVREGIFERHDFDEFLREVAEEVGGRWYLLETAGEVDAAESAKEERAATRLEAFTQRYLETNTTEQGVHYSDLFEQYLPIADKPRRLLADWLPEFFFKTEAGTWRPPRNDEERRQKGDLRASGTLRRVKRFGNALLEGVPPGERDRPENVATAADWLRQCRRAGLYAIGRALYEKGGFDFTALGEAERLEVEEDYQLCVRRSG